MGLLLPQQELAGAAAFDAGRQQSLPPLPPSHGTIGNSQALCTQEKQKRCVLACLQYKVFCVYAEVVGICW